MSNIFKLLVLLVCILSFQETNAQENPKKFSLGIENHFVVAGETSASFDFLLGVRGSCFFAKKGDFDFFTSMALAMDITNPESLLITSDAQLGVFWKKHKRLSPFVSIGPNYMQESHSLLLSNGQRNWQNSTWGISGNSGVNVRLNESFHFAVFIKQINLTYTSVGLGLNYSF